MAKDVIYLDAEDDITSVISKLKKSKGKVAALVPPKRTTVLNSVVNLKLLKKAANDTKKKLVLVTADESLMTLAGGLEIYVAKNLTSAPEVPPVAVSPELPSELIEDSDTPDEKAPAPVKSSAKKDAAKVAAIGALAGKFKKMKPIKKDKESLPDFNAFRKKLFIIVGGLLLLIGGGVWAAQNIPSAEVYLKGQTNRITSEADVTYSFDATEASVEERVVPATRQSIESTQTAEATATGEENRGKKATGTAELYNCNINDKLSDTSRTVPAGTVISSDGLSFTLDDSVEVEPSSYVGGNCQKNRPSDPVGVTAVNPGTDYNVGEREYSVSGYSSISAAGSTMSGGTDDVVTVVTQEDVDKALEQLAEEDLEGITAQLAASFSGEVVVIDKTLKTRDSKDSISPKVGEEGSSVKIERTATYSIVGVDKALYEQFLVAIHQEQLAERQVVVQSGISDVIYTITDDSDSSVVASISVKGVAGPDIDVPTLADELKGKGYTEAIAIAESIPGILRADIELAPFWASKMPAKATNITIEIDVSGLNDENNDNEDTTEVEQ